MSDGACTWDKRGWHVWDDGATYLVVRRHPVRWDFSAQTRLPDMGRRRLAHAVRQDMWRVLQRVRGFAPVVSVTRDAQGILLRAGGQVEGRMSGAIGARVAQMLDDPARHAAWAKAAAHRKAGDGR